MERIFQTPVPPLFPAHGPVRLVLYGEAPGPLGADKSGVPFWGDRAGKSLYRALERSGLAKVPREAYDHWDGAYFMAHDLFPEIRDAALSNAYPACPTLDGRTFNAPTNKQLASVENLARVQNELALGLSRCQGSLRVIAMGKRAEWLLSRCCEGLNIDFHFVPHPSAQGLLQAAPNKGKGMKLADLQATWEESLVRLLSVT